MARSGKTIKHRIMLTDDERATFELLLKKGRVAG
jgi:hypothetical protein